jgi:hypothetical protein
LGNFENIPTHACIPSACSQAGTDQDIPSHTGARLACAQMRKHQPQLPLINVKIQKKD